MIGAVENAILARLTAASEANVLGYQYGHIETYPDDWQAYWEKMPFFKPPAVWVTFGGFTPIRQYTGGVEVRAEYGVIVGARSFRNQQYARHGAGADEIGAFQMVADVSALLIGHSLGLSISALEQGACRYVTLTESQRKSGWAMLALQFSTQFSLEPTYFEPTGDGLDDFQTFSAAWMTPPKSMSQTIILPIQESEAQEPEELIDD